jgi:hypothetical protein
MKKPQNWDESEAFTGDFKSITPGGHICKIAAAKVDTTRNSDEMLVIMFDIFEGEFKAYYADQYKRKSATNPDVKWPGIYRQMTQGKGTPFFKGMITAIEESNPGFKWNWEEKTLTNKMFGGVFGQEEYEYNGDVRVATKCLFIRSVDAVKKGITAPLIKKLAGTASTSTISPNSFGREIFPEEEIPF